MIKFKSKTHSKILISLKNQIINSRILDWGSEFNDNAGISYQQLNAILKYWGKDFSWEKQEKDLNKYDQFKITIDKINTHFLHIKSSQKNALPLMLIHGWPGSIFEFFDLIPLLTNPEQNNLIGYQPFDLIIPSVPNVGFSFSLNQKPLDLKEISTNFIKLMEELGYKKYFIQGGDLGSFIASIMAVEKPDVIAGIHINLLPLPRGLNKISNNINEEKYYKNLKKWLHYETGYQQLQGTKPFTLAHALNSSPVALCSYISEKFYSWTDNDGDLFSKINIDKMLANITLYWITGCIGASFWPYYIRHRSDWPIDINRPILVPMGYSEFPKEIFSPPISLAQQFYKDIRFWRSHGSGGHFAAMEKPNELAEDISLFVKKIS
ncbi:epoxide hydrolase [Alphaproteobacteria bacterium]|jgi:pimeloyl-ACP methyl ester carboxylesterase|nr:epoxide hydrolase [Alphaproteobacteria bacterium]MDB9871870.1 epoxide hydrolase [Alphaproteobacteria bacterium]